MMGELIDCLLIGHNRRDFSTYERELSSLGIDSGLYHNIELSFVKYQKQSITQSEMFNVLTSGEKKPIEPHRFFNPAIAYLGTFLNHRGFHFEFVNSFQDEKGKLMKLLMEKDILTVGIITTLYFSFDPIVEIIRFIRRFNDNVKIIVGGPYIHNKMIVESQDYIEDLLTSIIGADYYVNSP